jgi:para-aminobenzoate synthetase component 1
MENTVIVLDNILSFQQKALAWANKFNVCCLLNSNHYPGNVNNEKEWVLAVDAIHFIEPKGDALFFDFQRFLNTSKQTVFGFIGYDLKNTIENLHSRNPDFLGFPNLFFFEPRYVITVNGNKVSVNRNYPETYEIIEAIEKTEIEDFTALSRLKFNFRTSESAYKNNVNQIRQKIAAGDFYEMNYCIEAFAENARLNPVVTYQKLNQKTQAPFSCYVKHFNKFLMCASPERFLKKKGNKLLAQPIKGTITKSKNPQENEQLKQTLANSEKERAENIMIVDLMRNDLAKSCQTGTVQVDELCHVYEFETVHQMISTISGTCKEEVSITDIIQHTFPMGSMTGAPKVEVMKAIDELENFQRNIFSGSVGYITPEGDFDFNVVIRSVFYNESSNYISLRSGSAITFDSCAESEWQEVLLKMKAMREVLE